MSPRPGHAVWIKAVPRRQGRAVRTSTGRFFVPPYMGPAGSVGVWLDKSCDWHEVADILGDAHRLVAPTRLIEALDGTKRKP